MTTRNILFPDGRPVTDKLDTAPGPSPATPVKSKKAFATVIEQAMHRRPAPSRSARTSSEQHNDAPGASPARARTIRLLKPDAGRPDEPQAAHQTVDPKRATSPGVETDRIDSSTASPAAIEPFRDLAADESGPEAAALPDGVPQNIVLFPAPSVIVPFPLEEAKAMGRSARAVDNSLAGEAAGEEVSLNGQRSTLNAEHSVPTPDASTSKAGSNTSAAVSKGVELAKLGLIPVEDSEQPENVHPVNFARAAAEDSATRSEPAVISVSFRPSPSAQAADPAATEEPPAAQTQLPGQPRATEESASMVDPTAPGIEVDPKHLNSTKAPARAGLPGPRTHGAGTAEATGISAARQESGMESTTSSKQPDALIGREATARQATGALEESSLPAPGTSRDTGGETLDFSARNLSATEWQTGRPVSSSDRPASDSLNGRTVETTGTVERISKLVLGEVALVKQYSSDSMAVVLRPDAETELFVHLTQRNGQIEATVRCERGDMQHLGALWGQLQESLAQQKVRLAPLQESPSNQSNFNQPSGSDTNGHSSPRQSQREGQQPDKQFMDEWPTPASSSTDPAHVRGRGGSRHRRLTTSRPGWETWA
jgi:hypothetical protein